jgi:hypothetical protein
MRALGDIKFKDGPKLEYADEEKVLDGHLATYTLKPFSKIYQMPMT